MGSSMLSKKHSVEKLKRLMKKLRNSLERKSTIANKIAWPSDQKAGHFVVLAVDGDQARRFLVALDHLSNPSFLKLLELAEEEFGFNQEGAIAIPCHPYELEQILYSIKGD